jgi:hypothetical protein
MKNQSGFQVQKIFAGEKLIQPTGNSPKKSQSKPAKPINTEQFRTEIFLLHPKLSKNRKVNPRDILNNLIFLKTVIFSE